jgi:RNA polymerase sigma factor (sigma-70 family)
MDTGSHADTLLARVSDAFARYQAGDRPALDELVEAVTPILWRTVRSAGLDPVTAEDVLQTVWLSLLRSTGTIRDPGSVLKWLITSARRESWRASSRSRSDVSRTGAVFGIDAEETLDLPEQRDAAPDDVVFRDERQRLLWHHVQELPARCRQLISVIAYADRPDYSHIAEALGMPVGSIGPTRGRCLAKLRGLLAADPRWEGQLT